MPQHSPMGQADWNALKCLSKPYYLSCFIYVSTTYSYYKMLLSQGAFCLIGHG